MLPANGGRRADPLFRPAELLRVALSSTAFFLILCAYYILRPVRDDMAVQFGADKLQWLFTGTFLLSVAVVPLFGWLINRVARVYVLPAVYGFFIINLLMFGLAFSTPLMSKYLAAGFFIWLSVVILFMVSVFWSSASDCFSKIEAHRLYGYIAAGGTAGALAGPAVTILLAHHVDSAYLIGLSALLLAGAAGCMIVLRQHRAPDAQCQPRPIAGSVLAGITRTFASPRLRGIALLVICYTAVSTALYVEIVDLAGKTYAESGERKAFFASIDLAVNCLALVMQLFGTRALVQRHGLRLTLPLVPLLVLAGLAMLIAWQPILAFAAVQVVHRAGEYAISRPGREMLYTTVDSESRYKGKNFIDITVYRANDAASAWLVALVRTGGLNPIAWIGIPAALAWAWSALRIGQEHDHLEEEPGNEST